MKNYAHRKALNGKMRKRQTILSPGAAISLFLSAALLIFAVIRHGGIWNDQKIGESANKTENNEFIPPVSAETTLPRETAAPAPTDAPEPIDPLILVNADHPLPADYAPQDLILLNGLDTPLFTVKEENTYLCAVAEHALADMLSAARQDGLTVWQISEGYRSKAEQQAIWDRTYEKYRTKNGLSEQKALQATARRVAKPGCSEHETGLALDVTVPGAAFRHTAQCKWLAEHCWEYGYIIRYTEEKEALTGITAEPWHIRYVGINAAMEMRDRNLCLEEYARGS